MAHPGSDLSIPALAERACLSPRQLARRFRAAFGTTPAAFVEEVRLSEACRRLTARGASVKHVAASLGFASDDAFRRAFERRFGVAPSSYRARFRSTPGSRTQRSKQENAR
jgi:transcriptional regulator GlxA family with amidase domain